jgi:hypothetical protein
MRIYKSSPTIIDKIVGEIINVEIGKYIFDNGEQSGDLRPYPSVDVYTHTNSFKFPIGYIIIPDSFTNEQATELWKILLEKVLACYKENNTIKKLAPSFTTMQNQGGMTARSCHSWKNGGNSHYFAFHTSAYSLSHVSGIKTKYEWRLIHSKVYNEICTSEYGLAFKSEYSSVGKHNYQTHIEYVLMALSTIYYDGDDCLTLCDNHWQPNHVYYFDYKGYKNIAYPLMFRPDTDDLQAFMTEHPEVLSKLPCVLPSMESSIIENADTIEYNVNISLVEQDHKTSIYNFKGYPMNDLKAINNLIYDYPLQYRLTRNTFYTVCKAHMSDHMSTSRGIPRKDYTTVNIGTQTNIDKYLLYLQHTHNRLGQDISHANRISQTLIQKKCYKLPCQVVELINTDSIMPDQLPDRCFYTNTYLCGDFYMLEGISQLSTGTSIYVGVSAYVLHNQYSKVICNFCTTNICELNAVIRVKHYRTRLDLINILAEKIIGVYPKEQYLISPQEYIVLKKASEGVKEESKLIWLLGVDNPIIGFQSLSTYLTWVETEGKKYSDTPAYHIKII